MIILNSENTTHELLRLNDQTPKYEFIRKFGEVFRESVGTVWSLHLSFSSLMYIKIFKIVFSYFDFSFAGSLKDSWPNLALFLLCTKGPISPFLCTFKLKIVHEIGHSAVRVHVWPYNLYGYTFHF